jgi:competence protein ComEA
LNTATQAELEALPGIGATKAQAILANRPYATVAELDRVPGIGSATIQQLQEWVVVGP